MMNSGLEKNFKTATSKVAVNFTTKKLYHGYRYLKRQKTTPKKVTFEQFWAAIQRIQPKQNLHKLFHDEIIFSKQSYSIPSTILDYLIKSCHTKCLFNLSKTCKELKYFCQKLRGKAVGYFIIGDEKCENDFGITTSIEKTESVNDILFICNCESLKYLNDIVCTDVLEIHCPKNGSIIQKQEKLSIILNNIKNLQYKKLIILSGKDHLIPLFDNQHSSLIFHENLTVVDILDVIIPLKYLPQLKNCRSIRFCTNFKDSKTEYILQKWKPKQKFLKFVIKVETCFIPESFIIFITNTMDENSIFAINVPFNFALENPNISVNLKDDEILHSLFCHRFNNLPRNCYILHGSNYFNQNAIKLCYQITFGSAKLCNDIFVSKNCSNSYIFNWCNICSFGTIL